MTPLRTQPAPVADPQQIAELAQQLTDGALNCREHRRHDWRPAQVTRQDYGYRRVEACDDCGSSRWQEMDSRGYLIKGGVNYSEGYLNPKGTGRVTVDGIAAYRLEAITRFLPGKRTRRAS